MLDNIEIAKICKSLELGREIIEDINQPIIVKDLNFRHLASNNLMNSLIPSANKNLHGKSDYDLPWRETSAIQFRAEDQIVLKNKEISGNSILNVNSNRSVSIAYTKQPLFSSSGKIIDILSILQRCLIQYNDTKSCKKHTSISVEMFAGLQHRT